MKEISEDEAIGDEVDADHDDLFTKVLHDNDKQLSSANNDEPNNKSNTQSISHDMKPTQFGTNVAQVDEYDYDSSDEEVRLTYLYILFFGCMLTMCLHRTC